MKRPLFSFLFSLPFYFLTLAAPLANEIVVTTEADNASNNGDCSLREAIAAANSDAVVDTCVAGSGDDTIKLGEGVFKLSTSSNDLRAMGDLDIVGKFAKGTLKIQGLGADKTAITYDTTISAPLDRLFHVQGGHLILEGIKISGGNALPNQDSKDGGAILVSGGGKLDVKNCEITNNRAQKGGAIFVSGGGHLSIEGTTIAQNSASDSGGGISIGDNDSIVKLVNSTISSNLAEINGGALEGGSFVLEQVTIIQNRAVKGGGLFINGIASLANSILIGNQANQGPDCESVALSPLSVSGHNILGKMGRCFLSNVTSRNEDNVIEFNQSGIDPVLKNNGGTTQTHALLAGSPAIDVIARTVCRSAIDQLGTARPQGLGCDIGAVEFKPPLVVGRFDFGAVDKTWLGGELGKVFSPNQTPEATPPSVQPAPTIPPTSEAEPITPQEPVPPQPTFEPPPREAPSPPDRAATPPPQEPAGGIAGGGCPFSSLTGAPIGGIMSYWIGLLSLVPLFAARGLKRR